MLIQCLPGGGVLLGILGAGVPPGSPNPNPISDQKMSFSTPVFKPGLYNPYPFSDLASMKLCHQLLRLERKHRDFLKAISNSHITLFFLFYLELKRQIRLYTPVVPSKTIPDSRPKWVKSTLVFRPERRKKTIPFNWGAHTYMAYIKEYSPPPRLPRSVCKGRPRFSSCQFPSKYSRRLFVLSLI